MLSIKVDVPYGEKKIGVEVPDKNLLGVFYPNLVRVKDEKETLKRAIENPINTKSLSKFLYDAKDVLFIINDQTRATPSRKVLDVIYPRIKNKRVKFLVATGIHRGPTLEELNFIFGKYYTEFKNRIYIHDSKKVGDVEYVGKTDRATEVWIDKLVAKSHKIMPIGSVEPHYFAGYTGGRKSFVPGVAAYRTIEQNHKYALSPEAKPLKLCRNPVHEDMVDALRILKKDIFSIQTVLDGKQRIYAASAGDIHASFEQAVRYAQEVFCVKIPEKADIVITVARFPLDVNLFQAHKAIEHAKLALKNHGILILVAPCQEGIGPDEWFKFMSSCSSSEEIIDKAKKSYKLGYHKAVKLAELTRWAEMRGVSELPDYIMRAVFIRPFCDLQATINSAIKKKGKNAKIIFLIDGTLTVPMMEEKDGKRC